MPKDKVYSPTEAEEKLVGFCKKEGSVDITVRQVGRTEWVYLGMTEPLFSTDIGPANPQPRPKNIPFKLLSLEGKFVDPAFSFTYDIIPDVVPDDPKSYGMLNNYNEAYTKKRQLIYQGLQESFFNLAKDEETATAAPIFFVIVIADITKGLATKNILYLDDLKAYMTGTLPAEEYYQRELSDIFGDRALIGDKAGVHLLDISASNRSSLNFNYQGLSMMNSPTLNDIREFTWPVFLTEQIKNRIRFTFSQSDFPPKSDPDNAVVTIAANTLRLYPFNDFESLNLFNRREKREMRFDREQLKTFEEPARWEKDKGKITVIKFQMPKGAPGSKPDNDPPEEDTLPDVTK